MKRKKCSLRTLIYFSVFLAFLICIYYNLFSWRYDNTIKSTIADDEKISDISKENEDGLLNMKIVKVGGDPSKDDGRQKSTFKQDLGTCKIPQLEVNGPEVIKFYKKFPPLICNKTAPAHWVFIDDERRVQPTNFAKNIGLDKIVCNWRFYDRENDNKLVWTPEEKFKFGDRVEKGDFLKVNCSAEKKTWTNPFMVVVPKQIKPKQTTIRESKPNKQKQPLSVYMLSFDSISQMSFRRNLPKTVAFIEKEMKSVVLNGYNIVGDGTPQAFIPILTAQTEEELPLTRKRYKDAHFVDEVYPFAWRNFSDAGYATMYGEDGHSFGTFTYRLKGFRHRPTDHYPITFFHYAETVQRDNLCVGAEKQHNVWFRYIESFWREYRKLGIPRFSVMHHSYLSHDDLNRVQQVDDDLVDHLKRMVQMGAFENTLAIVMADHGSRFSELRQTHQGQLEERLPFFSVHLPAFIRDSSNEHLNLAWRNLKTNANDRLTSPFDVHATLMDAIKWPLSLTELRSAHKLPTKESSSKKPPPGRSLSLFREIPLDRTCSQAGIEPHWCTCLGWTSVTNSSEVTLLSRSVVKVINDFTKPERKICAPLRLHRVVDAKKLVPNSNLLKYKGVLDHDGFVPDLKGDVVKTAFATYQIAFETRPGNAKYEVTLFYDGTQVTIDMTAISHINKYGDAPHCIIDKNYFMATYCICYDKIGRAERI